MKHLAIAVWFTIVMGYLATPAQANSQLALTFVAPDPSCGTQELFAAGIAARLGVNPFSANTSSVPATLTVRIVTTSAASGSPIYNGTIEGVGQNSDRRISATTCLEVVETLQAIIAVALAPSPPPQPPSAPPASATPANIELLIGGDNPIEILGGVVKPGAEDATESSLCTSLPCRLELPAGKYKFRTKVGRKHTRSVEFDLTVATTAEVKYKRRRALRRNLMWGGATAFLIGSSILIRPRESGLSAGGLLSLTVLGAATFITGAALPQRAVWTFN